MFDKFSRAAEKAAASVGRREFFGRLGRGAAALAAGLGGVLLTATDAEATGGWCCGGFGWCCKGKCNGIGITMRCSDTGVRCGNC